MRGVIHMMEITFDQSNPNHLVETSKLIKVVSEQMQGKICVGAGTVMNIAQCDAAFQAGAKYFITPNVNVDVIRKANELEVVSIPGALSPTEAAYAYEEGADFVKLFPAGDLGSNYIKSLCAPLNHIPFLAVGGVSPDNIKEFANAGVCGFGVGGKLIDKKAIYNGEYEKITKIAQEYTNRK